VGDKPTEFQKDIYNCSYEGLMAFTNCIKPGITNIEAANNWLEMGRGKGKWGAMPKWPKPGRYYLGSVAHQIGLCSGDPGPVIPGTVAELFTTSMPPLKLEENMCFAVEVGCYEWDGKRWARDGAKIEHCGVVTETGFEVFYRFPMKELIACGLPGIY
jgi:Xaa-Pro aminopeptidase